MQGYNISCFSLCWQVPPLQGKLQYMRVLNDLPPFGGILFQTVGLVMYFQSTADIHLCNFWFTPLFAI